MKKILKIAAVIAFAGFIVIQFFRPAFSNPEIVAGQPIESSIEVPGDVQTVFSKSCNDCHSNKTAYPWYAQVSPFSWFLSGHIEEGRRELNFSEWNSYSNRQKIRKLEELCEMVEGGSMPLGSYLWIHRDAGLNEDQKNCSATGRNRRQRRSPPSNQIVPISFPY